ncbi:MAG: glycosyltransferase, partial [Crenarchaeota archaeon]|nr:glycosyltransferase [Thermoproteota archaeon]
LIRAYIDYKINYHGDADLVIVGKGPLEKYIKKISLLVPSIRYLGYVPRNTLKKLYSRAIALILPSRVEGLPTTILEALVYGTRVITLEQNGVKKTLEKLGIKDNIIEVKNWRELSKVMKELEVFSRRLEKFNEVIVCKLLRILSWNNIIRLILQTYLECVRDTIRLSTE